MLSHLSSLLPLGLALLSLLPTTSSTAAGIHRLNQCDEPTWFQPVYDGASAASEDVMVWADSSASPLSLPDSSTRGPYEIPAGHSLFSHYQLPSVGGVSEKFAAERFGPGGPPPHVPIVQFEYKAGAGAVWFDLSFINCHGQAACVFRDGGYLLEFDGLDDSQCPYLHCPKTDDQAERCESAYHVHGDQHGTRACVHRSTDGTPMYDAVNMTLIFCPTREQLERHGR